MLYKHKTLLLLLLFGQHEEEMPMWEEGTNFRSCLPLKKGMKQRGSEEGNGGREGGRECKFQATC